MMSSWKVLPSALYGVIQVWKGLICTFTGLGLANNFWCFTSENQHKSGKKNSNQSDIPAAILSG